MFKKKFSKVTLATLITLAISSSAGVYAAELPKDVDLQDEGIVVTVNRTAQAKKRVSGTVDVITAKEIAESGATDLYQALKNVGDLNLGQSNKTGHFMRIRGMNSNHSLVLVDGKRVAGEDVAETQNVYALDRINLGNVERIEVVKGAASAQYGSDALGGVINIITKTSQEPYRTASINTSTKNNGINYHIGTGEIGKFSGDVNINLNHRRKVDNGLGSFPFYGNTQAVDFKGKYKVNDYDNIQLDLSYYKEKTRSNMYDIKLNIPEVSIKTIAPNAGFFARMGMMAVGLGNAIPKIDGYARKDQVVFYDNKKYDASLAYNGEGDKAIYSLRGYYSQLNKKQELFNHPTIPAKLANEFNKAVPKWRNGVSSIPKDKLENPKVKTAIAMLKEMPSLNPIKYDFDDLTYKVYGLEFNNTVSATDKHTITYSVDVHRSKVEGTRVDSPDAYEVTKTGNGSTVTRKYGHDDLTSMSFYFQDQFQADKKLNLLYGLRYDHDSYFGGKFTPRTGVVYNFNNSNRLKFNYATAFKAPTLSEMYMNRLHNEAGMEFYVVGNPNLRPETSENWDISYEKEFGKNKDTFAKVTYFNNRVRDLIHHKAISNSPLTYQYVNVDKADMRGVEFTLGTKLTDKWSTKLNYTWLNPRNVKTGERLDENAAQSGNFQFIYDDNKEKGWNGNLSFNLVRDYKFNKAPEKPGSKASLFTYTTTDLTVNRKLGKGSHAFVGVDNIFGVKRNVIGITGRMWRAGAEFTF